MIDSDVEIDHDYVVAEKIDDPVVIQKRGKRKLNSCDPDVAGVLNIIVHLITSTSTGDQLTKSRKSIPILIEKGELYVENIDLLNARSNINRPYISARIAHGLIVNHFGQYAADTLTEVSNAYDPHLRQ